MQQQTYWRRQSQVFFSEGFEGAIALFVDFDLVFNQIKKGEMQIIDKCVEKQLEKANNLYDYLGEGVYLCFDGTGINNERNFENGCTDLTISPEKLYVCALRSKDNNSVIFSRFEIIKYMMAKTKPEQIKYYGSNYENSPDFEAATARIQGRINMYYEEHREEIDKYSSCDYIPELIKLKDFIGYLPQ